MTSPLFKSTATNNLRGSIFISLVLTLLLGLVVAIYWPGLSGNFLLDDSINLQGLAQIHEPVTISQLAAFTFSGMSGGLGRPISMATFAAQFYSWPYGVTDFRYVNVLIHLLNGCLLFWLALVLGRRSFPSRVAPEVFALLTASFWLLHPLQVSTVLYTVQRMTELSALFILLSLLVYVKARGLLLKGHACVGYLGMSSAVVFGTLLATLSKENGILLPLYVLVLEETLLNPTARLPGLRWWKVAFLITPIIVLAGWFAFHFDPLILNTYQLREFTLSERMLTESRVLWDYAGKFYYPVAQAFGVFHDDFPLSRSVTSPANTGIAVVAGLVVIVAAIGFRRSMPFFSLAVLWFISGHILESTFIPLEIYFEHRNYLPIAGFCLATAHAAIQGYSALPTLQLKRLLAGGTMLVLSLLTVLTLQESRSWGMPLDQAMLWSNQHPHSLRAQEWLGGILAKSGYAEQSAAVYRQMAISNARDASSYAYLFHLSCHFPLLIPPQIEQAVFRLKQAQYSAGAISGLDAVLALKEEGKCTAISPDTLKSLIDALLVNPRFSARHANLYFMEGRLFAVTGNLPAALSSLDHAYTRLPRIETALLQATWAAQLGRRGDAYRHIQKADALNASNGILRKAAYSKQINELKILIIERGA